MSAEELKAKGNELFAKKDFVAASIQYSNAIVADPRNHVLFSNRSACYASIGRNTDALSDAVRCTELKPDWSKGWCRRGVALHALQRLVQAREAYEKALELEPTNPTAKASLELVNKDEKKLVAQAQKQQDELVQGNELHSMVRLMWAQATEEKPLTAYAALFVDLLQHVDKGWQLAKTVKYVNGPDGQPIGMQGHIGAIFHFSEAMVVSTASFAIGNFSEFTGAGKELGAQESIDLLQTALQYEIQVRKCVSNELPADKMVQEYIERVKTEGWDVVRPAFTCSVRLEIILGVLVAATGGVPSNAIQYFAKAMALLKAGKATLAKGVTSNEDYDRVGNIFRPTFLRALKVKWMDLLTSAVAARAMPPAELRAAATDLLEELEAVPENSQERKEYRWYGNVIAGAANIVAFTYKIEADCMQPKLRQEQSETFHRAARYYSMAAHFFLPGEAAGAQAKWLQLHCLCLGGGVLCARTARELGVVAEAMTAEVEKLEGPSAKSNPNRLGALKVLESITGSVPPEDDDVILGGGALMQLPWTDEDVPAALEAQGVRPSDVRNIVFGDETPEERAHGGSAKPADIHDSELD